MKKGPINMNAMITRWMLLAVLLAGGGFSYQVHATECYFRHFSSAPVRAGVLKVNSFDISNSTPRLLGELSAGKFADFRCDMGTVGADWYGETVMDADKELPYVSTVGTDRYSYYKALYPTSIEGVYYSVYIVDKSTGDDNNRAYLPIYHDWVHELDVPAHTGPDHQINLNIEIWQLGNIGPIGNGLASPTRSGRVGNFRASDADIASIQIHVNVDPSSFTVQFATPTCNLSVSPTTVDFGDVGSNLIYTRSFALKNSNCVNALGVTLKLTSTKTAYDHTGLAILANTTTGTSAASGRGVAVAYSEGATLKYLSANDPNSSASIDFGSMVNAKDIPMVGVFTCTSGNKSTCDNASPGAFTASGTISATYR